MFLFYLFCYKPHNELECPINKIWNPYQINRKYLQLNSQYRALSNLSFSSPLSPCLLSISNYTNDEYQSLLAYFIAFTSASASGGEDVWSPGSLSLLPDLHFLAVALFYSCTGNSPISVLSLSLSFLPLLSSLSHIWIQQMQCIYGWIGWILYCWI